MTTPPIPGPNRDPWPDALWDHPMPNTTSTVNLNEEGLTQGATIDPYFDLHVSNNTRVEIEPGTYQWNRTEPSGNWQDVHIIGLGDFGDVVLDIGTNNNNGININASGDSVLLIENLTVVGTLTDGNNRIRSDARTEGSEVIWKRCRLLDGNAAGVSSGAQGWYVGSHNGSTPHVGTLRLLWCQADWFVDNGCYLDGYAGAQRGQTIVVGGLYQNNNISHVRLGNDYSTAYRVTIDVYDYRGSYTRNQRGFWLRRPDGTESTPENEVLVDNCDIRYASGTVGTGAVTLTQHLGSSASGLIRNVRIENNSNDVYAVFDGSGGSVDYRFEDIHITGSGDTRAINVPSSAIVSNPDSPNMEPWWGLEEDPGDPSDPTALNPDRTSWLRRYVPEVDRFNITPVLAPYHTVHGSSTHFSRDTSITSPDSDASFRFTAPTGGSHVIGSHPGDGLLRYPERGEPFDFIFRQSSLSDGMRSRFIFYLEPDQDSYSGYLLDCVNGRMELYEFQNGSTGSLLDDTSATFSAEQWHRVRIDDNDGVMTFTMFSDHTDDTPVGSMTVTDNRHNGAGFYLWGPSTIPEGESTWWDQVDVPERPHDRLIDNFAYTIEELSEHYDRDGSANPNPDSHETADGFTPHDAQSREGNVSLRWNGLSTGTDELYNGPTLPSGPFIPIRGHYYLEDVGVDDDMEIEIRFGAGQVN